MKNYLNELTDSILKLVAVDSVENTPEAGAPFGKGTVEALEQALSLMKSWGFKVKIWTATAAGRKSVKANLSAFWDILTLCPLAKAGRKTLGAKSWTA